MEWPSASIPSGPRTGLKLSISQACLQPSCLSILLTAGADVNMRVPEGVGNWLVGSASLA